MTLRLQTAEGKIKEYETLYEICRDCGEYSIHDKWATKCGREWHDLPEPHEECDHLECAIRVVENWSLNVIFGLFFGVIAAIFLGIMITAEPKGIIRAISFFFSFIFAILAMILLVLGHDEKKHFDELNEFNNNGTINGIKASQIFEDHEGAKG